MKNRIKKYMQRHMLRPVIYKTFTRFILALTASLLWNEFVNVKGILSMKAFAFLFFGVFFLALAWIAYLRLDGIRLPDFMKARPARGKKRKGFLYGDIADYTDERIVSFDELEDDERDVCCLAADLICAAAFFILSAI